jgi:SAM-dependent methyltransferase
MLNWLVRYAPTFAVLESRGDLGAILDVGCGPHGLACVRPRLPFVGLDVDFGGPTVSTMTAVRADPGPLPFVDGAFDTVLCLDVLEHVPADDRTAFVAELARVAARQLVVACPNTVGQPLDDALLARLGGDDAVPPAWLAEHFDHGLPTPGEVAAAVGAVDGFTASEIAMPNQHLSALVVLGDLDGALAGQATEEYERRTAEWEALLVGACFGPSLRSGWLLVRDVPQTARVSTTDLAGSTAAAMRAPGAEFVA